MADDVDKQFKELMKYKKVDLAQMVILQRMSIETLNEIIDKLKRCGNCEHFLCSTCEVYGNADVLGKREPCEKWKMKE